MSDKSREAFENISLGAFDLTVGGTGVYFDEMLEDIRAAREALMNIGVTAQMASMHEPEQFCEYAYTAAAEALQRLEKYNLATNNKEK